jgi:site-specific DNA-methyltransferase (adenine-specific)
LLFYSGGSKDYTWNHQYVPLDQSYIDSHYSQSDENGRRFQWGDLRAPGGAAPSKGNPHYRVLGVDGYWRYTKEKMDLFVAEGRVAIPPGGNVPRFKRYLDESKGLPVGTVWDDINPVNSQAKESLGYPTQKPLPLLERIIKSSSNENDIVLDAFCGCGTALIAAQNLGRQWIGIDVSPTACRVMAKRLRDICRLPENEKLWGIGRGFVVRDLPWTEKQLRSIPPFEFENWAVIALGGIPNKVQVGDMGIDGRIYPVGSEPNVGKGTGELDFMDDWYPVQVKQMDKVGRPDIDMFQAAMMRPKRKKGFFIGFDFTSDALREISNFFTREHISIVPLTVREILDETIAHRLV